MARCCKITKDADNEWFVFIDWSEWLAGIIDDIGGTVAITVSAWVLDAGLSKDASTPTDDIDEKTFLYGSGGVTGQTYNVLNRITYAPSVLSPQTFTEDRTIQITIADK